LLAEGHYDRITFEAVADRAGCSRPSVYRRFRNKVDLVRTMVEPLTRPPEMQHYRSGPPREALIAYLHDWVDYLDRGGGPMIMALWQARREDPEMSAMLDDIYDQGRKPYVEALRGLSPRPAPEDALFVIIDAMLGAVLFRCVHRLKGIAPAEIELLVDQAIRSAEGA
jgi:AcrR family transcriptional regulator